MGKVIDFPGTQRRSSGNTTLTADEDAGPQARRHGTHPALAFNLEELAAAVFATLFDDLYVAYHCVYSDDETLSPEGAWALISENTFIQDHIFGVPEAVATQAVLGAAIAIGAGFDEWDTSEVVENPAGAAEYWMSKLDRARTCVRTVDELADRLWALSTPTWERVLGDAVLGSTARVGTAWTIPEAQRPNRRSTTEQKINDRTEDRSTEL